MVDLTGKSFLSIYCNSCMQSFFFFGSHQLFLANPDYMVDEILKIIDLINPIQFCMY